MLEKRYTELSNIEGLKVTKLPKMTEEEPNLEVEPNIISRIRNQRSWKYLRILNDVRPIQGVIRRLIASAIYYGGCLYLMSIMAVISGMRYPKHIADLPDLGFEIIPVLDTQDTTIPNAMLLVGLIGTVIRCFFHDKGITIIRRFLVIHGSCALLRCICMVATSYPDPNRLCTTYRPPATTLLFWKETVIHTGFLTCGDLMFSGHTLVYLLIALTWQKYFTIYEKPFVWIGMLFGCTSLIATRMHYTDDVLIAAYIAVTAFWFYHYAAQPSVRKNILILKWLESDLVSKEVKIERQDLLDDSPPSNLGLHPTGEQVVVIVEEV